MYFVLSGLGRPWFAILAFVILASPVPAAYFPNMVYGPKETLSPGVTHQKLTNNSPRLEIHVVEIDMTNRNVELVPVFKSAGNIAGSTNERTSSMAFRKDAVAAVNAGYYHVQAGDGLRMTSSYTEVDGVYIGGWHENMTAENGRSVLGFSGDHQSLPKRIKLNSSANPATPGQAVNWDKIVDAIAGRGHFVTSNGMVITQDNENTTAGHYDGLHPRTLIGYSMNPYRAFLVTVDGRMTRSVGATYTQLAQLMADLGVEESISLDGGGSTTMWIKDRGIVNTPSDGAERPVVSAWLVVNSNTMDNTVSEVTRQGSWQTRNNHPQRYHIDEDIAFSTAISGPTSLTWRPNLQQSGLYKVYAWWTTDSGRSTAVPYEIVHANGSDMFLANQRFRGRQWNLLGVYAFEAGTSGSVKISNTSSGSVSADAVRFVRFADLPEPIEENYRSTGVLYETNFETNVEPDFTLTHQVNNGNNGVTFTYDYSTFTQSGGGVPALIPPSPGSAPADRRALRMSANVSAGVINAITATLNAIPAQQNMRITFDLWQNYNGGSGGGPGSTQFATFGGSSNSAMVAAASSDYTSTNNNSFSGFYFALSGDGGSTYDFRYYDGTGAAARGNNAARANYLGTGATDNIEFGSVFPSDQFESPGAPGKAWITWEIVILDGKVRLIATKPDGSRILMTDWVTPNNGTPVSNLKPHFGVMDNYASSASPAADQFVLFDNLKVETITSNATVDNWSIY